LLHQKVVPQHLLYLQLIHNSQYNFLREIIKTYFIRKVDFQLVILVQNKNLGFKILFQFLNKYVVDESGGSG